MRYFFSQSDGSFSPDEEGTEFVTLHEARVAAVQYAGRSILDRPELLLNGHDFAVQVADPNKLVLFVITVSSADAPVLKWAGHPSPA